MTINPRALMTPPRNDMPVLARKASALRWQPSIGAWLHEVAYRTAQKTRASELRRQEREDPAGSLPEAASSQDPTWSELRSVLDEELQLLPATFPPI